jgi:hypothetical protein
MGTKLCGCEDNKNTPTPETDVFYNSNNNYHIIFLFHSSANKLLKWILKFQQM